MILVKQMYPIICEILSFEDFEPHSRRVKFRKDNDQYKHFIEITLGEDWYMSVKFNASFA
jgi:hypothetical protein